jgi:hypothetical protein
VQPSVRASLYGMKATVGSISTKGTLGWSKVTDSAGGLAKSPADLAALMGVLLNGANFAKNLTYSWKGLRVGFVDKSLWDFVPAICDHDPLLREQQDLAYDEAIDQIKAAGGEVQHPVPLPSMKELEMDGEDVLDQMWSKLAHLTFGFPYSTILYIVVRLYGTLTCVAVNLRYFHLCCCHLRCCRTFRCCQTLCSYQALQCCRSLYRSQTFTSPCWSQYGACSSSPLL